LQRQSNGEEVSPSQLHKADDQQLKKGQSEESDAKGHSFVSFFRDIIPRRKPHSNSTDLEEQGLKSES
jgi:hypothetical protein